MSLCAKQVAIRLGLEDERFVYRLWDSGELRSFRVGRFRRCREADVEAYLEEQYRKEAKRLALRALSARVKSSVTVRLRKAAEV